jgi:hypothetical protein
MQEPLNDDELNALLKQWEAPASAPAGMEQNLLSKIQEPPLWRRFWTMSIRIPAPVAAALIVGLGTWLFIATRNQLPADSTQDGGFEPVKEWKTTIVRSSYVSN